MNIEKLINLPLGKLAETLVRIVILVLPGYVIVGFSSTSIIYILLIAASFFTANLILSYIYLLLSKILVSRLLNHQQLRDYQNYRERLLDQSLVNRIERKEYRKKLKKARKELAKYWAKQYNEIFKAINTAFVDFIFYTGGLIFMVTALLGYYLRWWSDALDGVIISTYLSLAFTLSYLCFKLMRRSSTADRKLLLILAYLPLAILLIISCHYFLKGS